MGEPTTIKAVKLVVNCSAPPDLSISELNCYIDCEEYAKDGE